MLWKKDFYKFKIFINYLDKRFLQIYSKKNPKSIFISPELDFILFYFILFIEKYLTFTLFLLGKICLKGFIFILFKRNKVFSILFVKIFAIFFFLKVISILLKK